MSTIDNLKVNMLIRHNRDHPVIRRHERLLDGQCNISISENIPTEDVLRKYARQSVRNPVDKALSAEYRSLLASLRGTKDAYARIIRIKFMGAELVLIADKSFRRLIGAVETGAHSTSQHGVKEAHEDQEFFDSIGPEVGPDTCREEGCDCLTVSGSARCRSHLFELVTGQPFEGDSASN